MKLAFCLFKYFPYGGLQRDFLRIAKACQQQGHHIYIYTMAWQGDIPEGFQVTLIPVKGVTNHRQCQHFAQVLPDYLSKEQFDAIIGFNRLPGLDLFFAGDRCYEEQVSENRSWLYRFMPRYRVYAGLEKSVFAPTVKTHIMLLSEAEQHSYQKHYGTQTERFHLLPPGIAEDRRPLADREAVRNKVREELTISSQHQLILMVGSSFDTKGVDRAILAVASLPKAVRDKTLLINIGQGKAAPYLRLAERLGIAHNVRFLGPRQDVPGFLQAADLLIHPSYVEAGGMVLLEALVNGLPILVTANCGYAYHVERSGAGKVIAMPFEQDKLNAGLEKLICDVDKNELRNKALAYVSQQDFYRLAEKAVEIIEQSVRNKAKP